MHDLNRRSEASDVVSEADVICRLREVFANVLNLDVPSDDTDLLNSGLLDSLALVELLLHIEATFGLELELEEFEVDHFRSLRTIGATVAARCRAPSSARPVPADESPDR